MNDVEELKRRIASNQEEKRTIQEELAHAHLVETANKAASDTAIQMAAVRDSLIANGFTSDEAFHLLIKAIESDKH